MSEKIERQILTANHLVSGLSVYLDRGGEWVTDIGAAQVAESEPAALALHAVGKASEASNEVVGVYLVPVNVTDDGLPVPLHYRERMRARAYPSFWQNAQTPHAIEAGRVSI
jgi:hypothetical protein